MMRHEKHVTAGGREETRRSGVDEHALWGSDLLAFQDVRQPAFVRRECADVEPDVPEGAAPVIALCLTDEADPSSPGVKGSGLVVQGARPGATRRRPLRIPAPPCAG
ncbi:hypothetical protein Sliba_79370 [Streptomyces nigrescens]|uniref:Uncharacterized protein n=1 Tax=Streptomyces nigrescens TaxID=1920 RepID=A0A640TWC7_STRNI|nr:hypothetical protein Sliba_79370 [Streptomyces libani subsp. libani]GGV96016.1 hypothetical protein GCM10010500_37700 [Streptomyces libani subsp. libani]